MTFNDYQSEAIKTAIYPQEYKIMYPAMGLAGECGEILNKIKKVYRDKNGEFSDETKLALSLELGDVLWYIAALANDLGVSLNGIAEDNIAKLSSRKERGVIGGSGDNR